MYGYMNEHAGLAYVAQRQAAFECAARRSRLIRALKKARREGLDQAAAHQARAGSGCGADLG
jgi:hypothetical protein